jgi:effector-binding domain-containing protein
MKITLIILLLLLVAWTIYGYFSSRVEQAQYSLVEKKKGYEIRMYAKHIEAQTNLSGDYDQTLNQGFSIVAGYIFGGNKKKQPIAMTAPVTIGSSDQSQNIAMTAPVSVSGTNQSRTISFVMPKKYTMETLPEPTDSRVKIIEVPEKKFAVIRYSGWRSSSKNEQKGQQLLQLLEKDGVNIVSKDYVYAGYSAPFTPPWMARQEVMIEIN